MSLTLKVGTVVRIKQFPFTNQAGSKTAPVVVLSSYRYHQEREELIGARASLARDFNPLTLQQDPSRLHKSPKASLSQQDQPGRRGKLGSGWRSFLESFSRRV